MRNQSCHLSCDRKWLFITQPEMITWTGFQYCPEISILDAVQNDRGIWERDRFPSVFSLTGNGQYWTVVTLRFKVCY